MANNTQLIQLPELVIPATGSKTYIVENNQSFQSSIDLIANFIVANKDLISSTLSAGFMSTGNANLILNGLNSAPSALLSSDKVDFSSSGVNFFFNVDGGTFYDTFVNTSTFDGGTI